MFRKRVNPKVAAVLTVVTLAVIQWSYWKLLVEKPPSGGGQGMMGGGGPPPLANVVGLETVTVENWAGQDPGFQDGPGWKARFNGPNALALRPDGSLVVADSRNHAIRQVSPSGSVSTLAGGGPAAAGGAGSVLQFPSGVAVGKDGTIYVSDTGNHRVCRLAEGGVTLLAGGQPGRADGAGAAARFQHPGPLAVDSTGRIWVADLGNRAFRVVTPQGQVTTAASLSPEMAPVFRDLYSVPRETVAAAPNGKGGPAPSQFFTESRSAASVVGGVRVFAGVSQHTLFLQRGAELPFLLAGRIQAAEPVIGLEEGEGSRSSFATPAAVVAQPDGTTYVADYNGNCIRRVRIPAELLQ